MGFPSLTVLSRFSTLFVSSIAAFYVIWTLRSSLFMFTVEKTRAQSNDIKAGRRHFGPRGSHGYAGLRFVGIDLRFANLIFEI